MPWMAIVCASGVKVKFAARQRPAGDCLKWPGLWVGLSLGGFFDGILLHQILQWHHLLSGVDAVKDCARRSLRMVFSTH